MKTLIPRAHLLLFLLFGATVLACGSTKGTTPGGANGPADCSVDECAAIPEPPISPDACGPGRENEIGTSCQRAETGECHKVLTCGGSPAQ